MDKPQKRRKPYSHTFVMRVTDPGVVAEVKEAARLEGRSVGSYLQWLHTLHINATKGVPG